MRSQDSRILNRNERSRRFTANERVERMLVTIRGKMRMHSELGFATDAEQLLWLFFSFVHKRQCVFVSLLFCFHKFFFVQCMSLNAEENSVLAFCVHFMCLMLFLFHSTQQKHTREAATTTTHTKKE